MILVSVLKLQLNCIIVTRNGRQSGSSITCEWTWVPEDISTQATPELIKWKYWTFWKIKTTVFFIWSTSWSTDLSSFYYSGIDLFLIYNVCCKLCNISLLFFENNSRSYHYTGASYWRKNTVAVITQDRVIDDNLKRQIKNRTLCTCRLFLLTRIFQWTSNWSKVFEHLPTLFPSVYIK